MLKEVRVWFNSTEVTLPVIKNLNIPEGLSSLEMEDEILLQLLNDPLLKEQENLTWQVLI